MSNRARTFRPLLAALVLAGTTVHAQAAGFLEGSGWFTRAGQKTFVALSTECEAGQYKGYFELKDNGLNLSVRNALVTSITAPSPDTRVIEGDALVLGAVLGDTTAGTFRITVTDSTNDIAIELSTGFIVSSALENGDIHFRELPASCGTAGTDMTAPVIAMFSPVDGATVSGTTTLAATATDDSAVAGVQFYVNGAAIGPEVTEPPYSITGNSGTVLNGTYMVRARARDAAGNTHSSSFITATVDNEFNGPADMTPPTVVITSPLNGSTVSGIVTLSVAAADNVAVAGVQFFVDGNAVNAEDTTFPYQITGNSSLVANGNHTVMARVRDTSGNFTNSAIVTANVDNSGGGQVVRYEQDNPAITYTPAAAWLTASDPYVSGTSVVESNTAGSTATLTFTGTGVTWVGFRCGCGAGIANVYVDGSFRASVGAYSVDWEPQAKLYSVTGLTAGTHTFKIEVTGEYNPAGETAYLVIDAFDVIQ